MTDLIITTTAPLALADVNVTWQGRNADLPDKVPFDASDDEIRRWAAEAVRAGTPGIPADAAVDFAGFVVDRFAPNETIPYARLMLRPKTPFGA